jgi:hypothetical protein
MNVTHEATQTRRGRRTMFLLVALFFGPILLALLLGVFGLHPAGSKNKGEKIEPYVDLRAQTLPLADGSEYRWHPEQRLWRIAVIAPDGCAQACEKLVQDIDKVYQLFGKDADRVQILWMGELPSAAPHNSAWKQIRTDAALLAKLPHPTDPAGAVTYVIDPYGFVILRYAPGFDPGDLRYDVDKLLKLI